MDILQAAKEESKTMSEVKMGALQSKANTARTASTVVRHVQPIDAYGNVTGTSAALALSDASYVTIVDVDSDMDGLYTIECTGGAAVEQNIDFYIPIQTRPIEQIVIKIVLDSAIELTLAEFQVYAFGEWITDEAYSAGPIAADGSSQDWTSMFPLRDLINTGNKARIHLTVAGDCTAGCIVMVE